MSSNIFNDFPGYTGWIPDTTDDKDFLFIPDIRVPWGSDENLRETREYMDYWMPVYDQGDTASCTANAVAAALAYEYNRFKNITIDKEKFSPSRGFIYYNARKAILNPTKKEELEENELIPDTGSQARLALRSLQKWGICQDVTWPLRVETVKWYPGPYAFFEAQKCKLRGYQYKRLDVKRWNSERAKVIRENDTKTMDQDGDVVLNNLRSCISQGHPVVFGFKFYSITTKNADGKEREDWQLTDNGGTVKWKLVDVPPERRHRGPEKSRIGHAVLAIGFVDGKKKDRSGYVLCQNSWGSSETEATTGVETYDFFWMPYNYITDFKATSDFWMIDFSNFPSKL